MIQQNNYKTIRGVLLSKREGDYTTYAFENVESDSKEDKYLICTRMPNWEVPEIDIGQEVILRYQPVKAGIDLWYHVETGTHLHYKYSANYFIDFVPLTHVIDGKTIVEKTKLIVT